jgi:hypothetical protein
MSNKMVGPKSRENKIMGDTIKSLILILILTIVSCSSSGTSKNSISSTNEEMQELRISCLRKKSALDCAQYAYLVKSTNPSMAAEFNQRACALGEESSCFNADQTEKSSIEENMTLIQSASSDMYACYYAAAGEVKREESTVNKETKTIKVQVKLLASGDVREIYVQKNQVENAAVNCIKKIINSIQFEPGPKPQNLEYVLTVPKAYL